MNGCDPTLLKQKIDVDMYGPNLKILRTNDQVKELQTILRDKYATCHYKRDYRF